MWGSIGDIFLFEYTTYSLFHFSFFFLFMNVILFSLLFLFNLFPIFENKIGFKNKIYSCRLVAMSIGDFESSLS